MPNFTPVERQFGIGRIISLWTTKQNLIWGTGNGVTTFAVATDPGTTETNRTHSLDTVALGKQIRCILLQTGPGRPSMHIVYRSCLQKNAEQTNDKTHRDCLAVIWALKLRKNYRAKSRRTEQSKARRFPVDTEHDICDRKTGKIECNFYHSLTLTLATEPVSSIRQRKGYPSCLRPEQLSPYLKTASCIDDNRSSTPRQTPQNWLAKTFNLFWDDVADVINQGLPKLLQVAHEKDRQVTTACNKVDDSTGN